MSAFGTKTNERPGTRAVVRHVRVSAYKAREVLDLIRGLHVADADQVLAFTERDVAKIVRKALASAVANAEANDSQDGETLKVVACFADEGPTLKRWRPRARGRATRIRKRTCHITVIVGRMDDDELRRWREKNQQGLTTEGGRGGRRRSPAADRRARVAKSKKSDDTTDSADEATDDEGDDSPAEVTDAEATVDEAAGSRRRPGRRRRGRRHRGRRDRRDEVTADATPTRTPTPTKASTTPRTRTDMGQKVNPYGFRLGVTTDWKSRWFAGREEYADLVIEDWKVRDMIMSALPHAAISRIEVERTRDRVRVDVHTARPGIVIGRRGAQADELRASLTKITGNNKVQLNIQEIKQPELDAALIAQGVADQLAGRVAFRRAMKRAVQNAQKAGALGIRVQCSGRLVARR